MNVGFIGLGIMGKPMAGKLIEGGHTLYLQTRSGVPAELTAAGGTACATPKEVAQKADIIITMVPDTPDVEEVLFGENGVADGLSKGKIIVDMSSISPIATRAFAERMAELGVDYVDAPVSGGEVGAKNAALTIMVGATEATFEKVKPLFELMGKNITLVGGIGAGQVCKVANQIVVALNIEAVGEALLLASKAGVDPVKVRQALMGGFASKDLNLALSTARGLGMSLPNTATAQELFNACQAHGGGQSDHSAMVKALETLANHTVAE